MKFAIIRDISAIRIAGMQSLFVKEMLGVNRVLAMQ
jgi:hypothetical protein